MKNKYYFYLSIIVISISLCLYIYNNSVKDNTIIEKEQKIVKININTANEEELVQISGIGEQLAKSIIEYRNKNGDFKNINELLKIKGIKEKKLNSIKEFIYVQSNGE